MRQIERGAVQIPEHVGNFFLRFRQNCELFLAFSGKNLFIAHVFRRQLNIVASFPFMCSGAVLAAGENGEPPSSNKIHCLCFSPWEGYGIFLPVILRQIESFSLITILSILLKRVLPV